ncbi:Imidazole glycerol phosphate synthase amidotransferase subunit [Pseudoalteromonas luteoviolacea B = ATCC 29581]|nr:Imidazole glycerol phosphate synthase amidotransferase subunit [Pseudoalteromonas luteoviolacea B = ATCC 29581]
MIAIINTGCANINSVKFAFERLGVSVEVISDPKRLNSFERAVLPGVGHAQVAMKRLIETGWDKAIKNYKKPLLGICLGMQLLCESTAEGEVTCLGVIPGRVDLLDTQGLTTPHMGWNDLNIIQDHPIVAGLDTADQVYFVHSFAHTINSATLVSGEYGSPFSAIVAKDNYIGMQFHPERSAKVGTQLLNNFLTWKG